jgi:hypothetical protein
MVDKVGGSQGILNQAAGVIKDKLKSAVGTVLHGVVDALVGAVDKPNCIFRQQVAADRWYFDNKADFKTTKDEFKARGWAILYTIEGAVRAAVEGIRVLFAKYVSNSKEGLDKNETILNAQIRSLKYTAYAIIDPVGQKKSTQEEFNKGNFPVGCANDDFHWGDQYHGSLTIPVSFDYHWHPKA